MCVLQGHTCCIISRDIHVITLRYLLLGRGPTTTMTTGVVSRTTLATSLYDAWAFCLRSQLEEDTL